MSEDKPDMNKWIDGKAIAMCLLIGVSGYFWNESQKSRERFENLIILNDQRLSERSLWIRVTDIRLSIIEKKLGIEPFDQPDFDIK